MKHSIFLVVFLLCILALSAQVQDDFNDGDFTQGTLWEGSSADFIINASSQLQLNSAEAGQSYLATSFDESTLDDREWNIWVRHTFAGSGNNFTRIYLSSMTGDLSFSGSTSAGAQGYFLLLGEAGADDAIRFFRDGNAGEAPVEVAAGTAGLVASTFAIRIRVTRDDAGNWQIFADPNGGEEYQLEAEGTDATYTTATHLGMTCTYTVSNADRFYFDDVYFGPIIEDEDPPVVEQLTVVGANTLQLLFNEALDETSAENTANYSVDAGVGAPQTATLDALNPALITLNFAGAFPGDSPLNLFVSGVEDLAGNPSLAASFPFTYFESAPIVFDDFSDGDFTNDPVWMGTTDDFIVNEDFRLQLNASEAGQSYLSSNFNAVSLNEREWSIWVKHEFAGSGSNNTRIYLSTQNPVLQHSGTTTAGALGYYLLLGEAGPDDAIRLFRDGEQGSSPVEIAAGTPGLVANAFEIRIRVVRDNEGNWQIFADPTGGENYFFEAAGFDNTYALTSGLGVLCNYTASNVAGFAFDEVYFGPVIPDLDAPVLLSVTATSENTLTAVFNEPLDETTAQIAANYVVTNPVGAAVSAVLDDNNPSVVYLTFGSAFPANENLTLTVNGVEDLAGNSTANLQGDFIYIIPAVALPGDIVINEMMVDPTPALGLPPHEFVELFNASESVFDLANWVLVNTTTARTLPSMPFFPGDFVILCSSSDAAAFESYGSVIGIDSWVALTNSADSLTLISADAEVIDIVSYDISWYGNSALSGGGVSLERINPFAGCSGSSNWTAAQTFQGGTAGAENSVFNPSPDVTPPSYTGYEVFGDNGVIVHFDEPLEPEIIETTLDYLMTPDIGEANIAGINNFESLRFIFEEPIEIGVSYILTLVGVADCSGNEVIEPIEIEVLKGAVPAAGDLIINEIMARPSSSMPSPNVEYVEVFNRSDALLELASVRLENGEVVGQHLLPAGSYAVLTRENDVSEFEGIENVIPVDGFPQLTIGGRTIRLYAGMDELVDEVSYTDQWYNDPAKAAGGFALERINPDHPCSDQDNWTGSEAPDGHTASAQNSVYSLEPDDRLPGIEYVFVSGVSSLDIYFDKQLDPVSAETIQVDVGTLNNGTFTSLNYVLVEATMQGTDNRIVQVTFSGGFSPGPIYGCRISQVSDCWGTTVSAENAIEGRFAVPEVHEPGDLIINEILFNPPADGGVDFVEIYNVSSKNISLEGWQLANEADGEVANFRLVTTLPYILYPGEYLVLTTTAFGVVPFYPGARAERILEMVSLPSYNNGDGVVILADAANVISDRVPYEESMHYPLLRDVKGVSLERLDFLRDSDDETNWHSASEVVGFATPGYENSQFSAALSDGILTITPEVFSPDNDGFDDNCLISYEMPRVGFTGSISIYDDLGRPVRKLVNNALLGGSGTFSWDGFSDDRIKGGIGIYIVFFEAFHPDGEVIQEKGVAVIGHYLD